MIYLNKLQRNMGWILIDSQAKTFSPEMMFCVRDFSTLTLAHKWR